jgi:hypothetical protein
MDAVGPVGSRRQMAVSAVASIGATSLLVSQKDSGRCADCGLTTDCQCWPVYARGPVSRAAMSPAGGDGSNEPGSPCTRLQNDPRKIGLRSAPYPLQESARGSSSASGVLLARLLLSAHSLWVTL